MKILDKKEALKKPATKKPERKPFERTPVNHSEALSSLEHQKRHESNMLGYYERLPETKKDKKVLAIIEKHKETLKQVNGEIKLLKNLK